MSCCRGNLVNRPSDGALRDDRHSTHCKRATSDRSRERAFTWSLFSCPSSVPVTRDFLVGSIAGQVLPMENEQAGEDNHGGARHDLAVR